MHMGTALQGIASVQWQLVMNGMCHLQHAISNSETVDFHIVQSWECMTISSRRLAPRTTLKPWAPAVHWHMPPVTPVCWLVMLQMFQVLRGETRTMEPDHQALPLLGFDPSAMSITLAVRVQLGSRLSQGGLVRTASSGSDTLLRQQSYTTQQATQNTLRLLWVDLVCKLLA